MHQREASLPVAVSVVAISVYWRRHVHVHALTLSRSYNEAVVTPCYSFIPSFLPFLALLLLLLLLLLVPSQHQRKIWMRYLPQCPRLTLIPLILLILILLIIMCSMAVGRRRRRCCC